MRLPVVFGMSRDLRLENKATYQKVTNGWFLGIER